MISGSRRFLFWGLGVGVDQLMMNNQRTCEGNIDGKRSQARSARTGNPKFKSIPSLLNAWTCG